ncbi:MAG: membrane protein insertase YidC [Firmicutes bacterium]|uniref:Membrane protein insertase YidC n=1 Tax=Candidatus Scatoplasma merdavium TaxID=2840932 RepID=A0A9D9D9B9_9BACL|nr:membrane protein insertase YidC [Candidatus Scatoplasma merdavium]
MKFKFRKFIKRFLIGVSAVFCLLIFTSCTRSFCSINDLASMYNIYDMQNREEINKQANEQNYIVPNDEYWTYIDDKVDAIYNTVMADSYTGSDEYSYIPQSYIDSHHQFLNAEEGSDTSGLVNVDTMKGIIRFTGKDSNGSASLWANINKWTDEYRFSLNNGQINPSAPTIAYMSYYQNAISSGVGNAVTCLTPSSGYFGLDHSTYVEGKSWGQAFSEYGFLEGLLVYPIGWLLHTFTTTFGVDGAGQVLAIFLVTLICRLIIVLLSTGSYSTQYKMTEIQPQLQMLQARYPNAQSNTYERDQLAQAQMKLYKDNHIHIFSQFLVLIVQFPLFICVWGALQGSAILTQGTLFGLPLSTVMSNGMTQSSDGQVFAILLFFIMVCAQALSVLLPNWIQEHRRKKIVGDKTVKVEQNPNQSMMKYMPYIMLAITIFFAFNLPAAMIIYWYFTAIISMVQSLLLEVYHTKKRSSGNGKGKKKSSSYRKVDQKKKKHMSIR